ncbi:MAG TPA: CGNR zinc finger domain-containing protein [Beutenbergiaceae bacterium]|nr:CGNR zinc finger domain-containing protein [Beutenbergiaceae bacterium]
MSAFLPLTGEPLAIDLVNTRVRLPDIGWVDTVESLSGLQHWVARQDGRLTVTGRLTKADLAGVLTLRDHVATALQYARRRERPPATPMAGINHELAAAAPTWRLTWSRDGRLVQEKKYTPGGGPALLHQLAQASADLLSDPMVTSVQDCAMPDCVVQFYPTNSRRKWCVDAICGNRARVARHYRKKRSALHHQA